MKCCGLGLIFIVLICSAFSTENNGIDISNKECYDFYNHFEGLPKTYVLEPQITFESFCLDTSAIYKDTVFTRADVVFMLKQQKKPVIGHWIVTQIKAATLIEQNEVERIFNNDNLGWDFFYTQYGIQGYYQLGIPLFSIKHDRCIAYVSNYCGGLCGSGEMYFCKKQGQKWVVLRTYTCWVS